MRPASWLCMPLPFAFRTISAQAVAQSTSWLPAGQMLCRVCAPPAQCLVAGPLICAKLGRPIGFMLGELAQAQQRLVLPWARQALAFRVRRGTPGGICRAEHTDVSHVAQASGYEGSQGSNLE